MTRPLPTANELERLPLRAVVAYAARSVRRLSAELRGLVADDIVENVLTQVDAVCTYYFLGELDQSALYSAAADVAGAMSTITPPAKIIIGLSLTRLATAASMVIEAAEDATRADRCMARAAKRAEKAVQAIKALDDAAAATASAAAREDYEILLREYGPQNEVVIGDPVDCFDGE